MNSQKTFLLGLSTQDLIDRRRQLAVDFGDIEQVLLGSLTEQLRRCGKAGCRCAVGRLHGPYAFFTPRGMRGMRYVPAALLARVRAYLQRGTQVEAILAEISAINAELLARRALTLRKPREMRRAPPGGRLARHVKGWLPLARGSSSQPGLRWPPASIPRCG
jgi:hypothetical protein